MFRRPLLRDRRSWNERASRSLCRRCILSSRLVICLAADGRWGGRSLGTRTDGHYDAEYDATGRVIQLVVEWMTPYIN